jgi:hypothetical protein
MLRPELRPHLVLAAWTFFENGPNGRHLLEATGPDLYALTDFAGTSEITSLFMETSREMWPAKSHGLYEAHTRQDSCTRPHVLLAMVKRIPTRKSVTADLTAGVVVDFGWFSYISTASPEATSPRLRPTIGRRAPETRFESARRMCLSFKMHARYPLFEP